MIISLKNINLIKNNKFKYINCIIVKNLYLIIDQFNLSEDILNIIITYLGRYSYKKYYKDHILSQILIMNNLLYTKIGTHNNILCSFCILYGNEIRLNLFSNIGYVYTHPLCWNCEFNDHIFTKIYYITKDELYIIKYKYMYSLMIYELKSIFNKKNLIYPKSLHHTSYIIN
jgi:hypothetical protein